MLPLLLILKILLFMNITRVKYNRGLVFLISLLVILFCFTFIYLSNNKKKYRRGFKFYAVVSAIMFADVVYYTYFNTLPSIRMIKQMGQVTAVGDSVKTLLSIRNLLFLLDLPLTYIYSRKRKRSKNYNKYIRWGIPGGLALILIITLIILSKISLFGPVTNQEIFTYHAKDIKKTIMKEDITETVSLTGKDLDELKQRTKLVEGKYTGLGKGKNLIVIQVESLQNFVINHYYEGQEVTPNLNGLIKEQGSLYFNNYYQLIGRGNTSDAEFVTHNSLYPSMEEPTYTQYVDNTFYGLPWILRDQGYTAWALHGYEKEFWNRDNAYVNQGFQRFISQDDYELVETIGFGITDGEFFKQSMDYLKELDSIDDNPFYAFMITLTSHNPFKMPEKYEYLDIKKEHKDTLLGNYLQSVQYLDKVLGEFIEELKKEGLYEESLLVIYGDHFAINSLNKEDQKLMTDYLGYTYDLDEMMKVPLIIHIPALETNETINRVGSMLDFMPTILNIMGYENEKGLMFGRDLINYEGQNFVAPQTYALKGSIITDEILLEMSRDGVFENSRVYNIKTRAALNPEDYIEEHKMVIEEINKSDYILKTDFFGK
ncbi:putative Lipoteichoic acid synthase-like YqgS [[Clostridium] ultunense Esp]|uniref:Putative Lipoteichoic acid synthase-like YqgS n=1 Tax=[Clostridium] ultunense Esp TaxID=1288971 RepID=M1Z5D7_9FIRM|nr:LTA synthase family protein [Schnuerera ultunensis]CCQ92743.1 putative Lipoteichoic acid synthase-like YqgS [[Clostridium] ultunense Esp]SHD76220.1 putative Lipoteichoic acid synthase-like YqgS [[Clostridium] ultunense Esp]